MSVTPFTTGAPSNSAGEEHHRQAAGRHDDVGAGVEQRAALAFPKWFQFLKRFLAREGIDEVGHRRLDRAHADHALLQAVADHLVLVPRDEDRVDGDRGRACGPASGVQQRGLAQAEHRDLGHRLHLGQARVLEMRDRHRVVALLLGLDARCGSGCARCGTR